MARAVKVAPPKTERGGRARGEQKALFDIEALELVLAVGGEGRRKSYARIADVLPVPSLIDIQLQSFRWFQEEGLRELFEEIFPIESLSKKPWITSSTTAAAAGGKMKLELVKHWFDEPKHSEQDCRIYDMTYASPLYIRARMVTETGERLEQDVYLGDFPLMTQNGTFVINGAERVVVSQLIRSSGIYFKTAEDRPSGRMLCSAKMIPNRGAWLEFETSKTDIISVKVDRKRKLPVTLLLRALGALDLPSDPHRKILTAGTDEELLRLFQGSDSMPDHQYIASTVERDPIKSPEEAIIEFFRKMRPGDPAKLENAQGYLTALLFSPRRYSLALVGRYKLNSRLGVDLPDDYTILSKLDLVKVVEHMILVNNGVEDEDDIDDLANRRVKTVGELIQNQLRIGLLRLERVVRERMSTREPEDLNPLSLINIRPVVAAIREFFGGSQLSQFMDQTNPLAELTHKRRLSALGPGGLRRERAGFDVRDVHHSHYGRICPIETPEGPNIGLIGSLATYGRVNKYGFIETPYRKVQKAVANDPLQLVGKTLGEDVLDRSGKLVAKSRTPIGEALAQQIAKVPRDQIRIRPRVTEEIVYLSADEEERYTIAQANAELNEKGEFIHDRVSVRRSEEFLIESVEEVGFMDVSPKQIVSVSAALIPFLEHDDANRALMGSNMQRQAVPLLTPEAPLVSTGIEFQAALDSGQVVVAEEDGEVIGVTSEMILVRGKRGERAYSLRRFNRSNQGTCIDQRPIVEKGQKVRRGEVLADSSSTDHGELALGQNVLVAFLSWEGGNYEDAVLVSETLVRDDKFTSVHIEKHEIEARDTKLGSEEITRDIPNVGEEALKDLDEEGIIRIGAEVNPGDILVGKITPKGETDLTPEEKLLRAIFGEKAREVKDSSLRLPHGAKGKVVDIKVFTRDSDRELAPGVEKMVRVAIAQRRKLSEGDKMAGRHGNKGVISKVVPLADMPFLADGTPVELILNPLGVPGRMNLGQILETHLGWAISRMGMRVISPVFDGADEGEIQAELARAWLMDLAWQDTLRSAWAWYQDRADEEEENLPRDGEGILLRYLSHLLPGEDHAALGQDRVLARRRVLREWLKAKRQDADKILVFEGDSLSPQESRAADQRALDLCLQMWLAERGYPVEELSGEALQVRAEEVSKLTGWALPTSGKMVLYDGRTGEPYDHPVTVGVINMMKLAHLVEDKVHARSIGPYSLVTQQPLGGKAQFGGQRFGEMEVWALEAYGAAHILQEMLTVKSDDVSGRVRTYEAIVKGEPISEPGVPESFRVLVKELQSLGLAVEVEGEDGNWMEFGKEDSSERPHRPGLWGLGRET